MRSYCIRYCTLTLTFCGAVVQPLAAVAILMSRLPRQRSSGTPLRVIGGRAFAVVIVTEFVPSVSSQWIASYTPRQPYQGRAEDA